MLGRSCNSGGGLTKSDSVNQMVYSFSHMTGIKWILSFHPVRTFAVDSLSTSRIDKQEIIDRSSTLLRSLFSLSPPCHSGIGANS